MTTAKQLSPARPGNFTKELLLGHTPLITEELVTEACATDIHKAYQRMVADENQRRLKTEQLKGMTWLSFVTMLRFARYLGLIELVREEPMTRPLYRVHKDHEMTAVVSTRRIYKLTDDGEQDERCWSNITKAYKEHWTPPLKMEYGPIIPPKWGIVPLAWEPKMTKKSLNALIVHLGILGGYWIGISEVDEELERLAYLMKIDWIPTVEGMDTVLRELEAKDIYSALDILERLAERV